MSQDTPATPSADTTASQAAPENAPGIKLAARSASIPPKPASAPLPPPPPASARPAAGQTFQRPVPVGRGGRPDLPAVRPTEEVETKTSTPAAIFDVLALLAAGAALVLMFLDFWAKNGK